MVDPHVRVGIDLVANPHHVGIAGPDGSILEKFDISHAEYGSCEFVCRLEHHKEKLSLPVAVATEDFNGYAPPLDRQIQMRGYALYN